MTKYFIANWKMNKSISQSKNFVRSFLKRKPSFKEKKVIICPSFTVLSSMAQVLKGTPVILGAQDVFWKDAGPYTGEISAEMLKSLGVQYVIVGHSERKKYFNETNEMINRKIKQLLRYNITPVLCVGETESKRRRGDIKRILCQQLKQALSGVGLRGKRLLINYEPVWAISTEGDKSMPRAAEVSLCLAEIAVFVKKLPQVKFSKELAFIYGGNVNPSNVAAMLREKNIDGFLIGGASLSFERFYNTIESS